jgi:hypothetical protein
MPVGIEVLDFGTDTIDSLNQLLSEHGYPQLKPWQLSGHTGVPPAGEGKMSDLDSKIRSEIYGLLSDADQSEARPDELGREQRDLEAMLRLLGPTGIHSGKIVVGPVSIATPTLADDGSLTGTWIERMAVRVPDGLGLLGYWVSEGEDEPELLDAGEQELYGKFTAHAACSREQRLAMVPHVSKAKELLLDALGRWRPRKEA